MDLESAYTPLEKLKALEAMEGLPRPKKRPTALSLDVIEEVPEVFQPRTLTLNEKHFGDLTRVLQQGGRPLDPIEVIQLGERVFLTDGHHRIAAYKAANFTKPIPVDYFNGTVREAVIAAGTANSKAKLQMTQEERMNRAWQLVKWDAEADEKMGTVFTKVAISVSASVATSTVSNMRSTLKRLGEDAFYCDTWEEARNLDAGRNKKDMSEEEIEAMLQQQAEDCADRMAKTFSNTLANNPSLAARAFDMYFNTRLGELVEELQQYLPESEECDDFEENAF